MNEPNREPLYTVKAFAEHTQLSESKIWNHILGKAEPPLKSIRIGRSRRIRVSDADAFLRACEEMERVK